MPKKNKYDNVEFEIGSPDALAWKKIREAAEEDIRNSKRAILINEVIIKLAQQQFDIETEKFK